MQNQIQNPPAPEGRRNSSVSSFKQLLHRGLNLYLKNFLTIHPNKTFNKIVILLFITSCITIFACRERVTPPDTPQYIPPIVLSLEDVSCTDAFIRVRFVDTTIERSFILKRDGATVASVANSPLDTMLIDENLLPKRIYRYKAYRVKGGASVDSSMELRVETMDTTSHDFTWQIDTLGDGYSVLRDVAIINDTLAYAVGEIYKRDSVGNWDPQPYSLAIWNGRFWSLRKIMVVSQQGDTHSRVLRGVYAFSATDVWFGDGNAFHWDGQSTFATAYWISGYPGNPTPVLGPNQGVHKFWGTSSSNLYGVGVNGGIAHYDGARWRRLESGTDLTLKDIYGVSNNEIYICGGRYRDGRGIVIKCDGTGCKTLIEGYYFGAGFDSTKLFISQLFGPLDGIWKDDKGKLYVVGDLIYEYVRGRWNFAKGVPDNDLYSSIYTRGYAKAIRGYSYNDLVLVGERSTMRHYNGKDWKQIGIEFNFNSDLDWLNVDMKKDIIIAVGKEYEKAVAIVLKRNK